MKKTYNAIDYEWLTRPTGDPFVDAGGYALDEFANHFPELDILELIMKATDIYVDRWDSKINPFFLNSKITQPAFKGNKKKEENKRYFLFLLKNEGGKEGICRITGRKSLVFPGGRDNSILSGSRTFVNFHHDFQNGIMLSKEVIIRYFFLPLSCEQLQSRISLISSSDPKVSEYFSHRVCDRNLSNVAKNISQTILKTKSFSPGTSLFRYADMVINDKNDEFEENNASLILYHFTNFATSPDLTIHHLPFNVLCFYRYVKKAIYKDDWNSFVSAHYVFGSAKYDSGRDEYIVRDKKSETVVNSEEFKYWRNTIYDKLLAGKTIIGDMLSFIRSHTFNFNIVRTYQIKIRHMKKETIDKIEQMADFIISTNDTKGVSKIIKELDSFTKSVDLRRFVIKDIVRKNYEEGNEDTIVTVNDYVNYLFPDINSWKDTRDILLIAIYERLHKMKMHVATNDAINIQK